MFATECVCGFYTTAKYKSHKLGTFCVCMCKMKMFMRFLSNIESAFQIQNNF